MRTLVRIRQLANGKHAVQLANLQKKHHAVHSSWLIHKEFSEERDAELYAREFVDNLALKHVNESSSNATLCEGFPRTTSKYWLYPRRDCRICLG